MPYSGVLDCVSYGTPRPSLRMLRDPTHAVQVKWALLSKDLYW